MPWSSGPPPACGRSTSCTRSAPDRIWLGQNLRSLGHRPDYQRDEAKDLDRVGAGGGLVQAGQIESLRFVARRGAKFGQVAFAVEKSRDRDAGDLLRAVAGNFSLGRAEAGAADKEKRNQQKEEALHQAPSSGETSS